MSGSREPWEHVVLGAFLEWEHEQVRARQESSASRIIAWNHGSHAVRFAALVRGDLKRLQRLETVEGQLDRAKNMMRIICEKMPNASAGATLMREFLKAIES